MEYVGFTLKEYLIKYSNVNKSFINDFIQVQNSDISQIHKPFVIDLKIVMDWLQITDIKTLRDTLTKSYIKDVDYIIIKNDDTSGKGGYRKIKTLLTTKCFKKICLKTKSKLADKIIDYYIALEELVLKYQQDIINILINENKSLHHDLLKNKYPDGGAIYIIDLGNGYYKLGHTKNLNKRLIEYNVGSVHKHKIVFLVSN